MRVFYDEGAYPIEKAHKEDAGYDLKSRDVVLIKKGESAVFGTGVHVEISEGYFGSLRSKSGLNVKRGILSDGVIDSGYTGSIIVKLYNFGDEDYLVQKGNKITQLIIQPIMVGEVIEEVRDITELKGERGNNGFGSSGQ